MTKLKDLFENENNDIGLKKGNVSIFSDVKAQLRMLMLLRLKILKIIMYYRFSIMALGIIT